MDIASEHYDNKYFSWQAAIGEFGGWADQCKFKKYISINDTVLDFGCGGGYLLNKIVCKNKIGIEVNFKAAECARLKGISVYQNANEVPNEHVDIIISNHALEHTLNPYEEIKTLHNKLKNGGKIIFVVPCESVSCRYQPKDINHHLYSWSPMCLGNLFTEAGFTVLESKPYFHKWVPMYRVVAQVSGKKLFEIYCRIYGRISRSMSQIRLIAIKNTNKLLLH